MTSDVSPWFNDNLSGPPVTEDPADDSGTPIFHALAVEMGMLDELAAVTAARYRTSIANLTAIP